MSRWISPRRRSRVKRPNHNRVCKWRRRSLHLCLVIRCRCRPRCRPPRLDGALFLRPLTNKLKRWKRGRIRAQMSFNSARLLKFARGALLPHQPYIDLSRSSLDHFCDRSRDFLILSQLFSINHSFDHSRCAQKFVNRFNMIRGTFGGTYEYENSSPHTDVTLDPKYLILIWDTDALYGLTPFRSDFIDYVACTIPVRDFTKVNTVIGIGTTLHKFTDTKGSPVYLPCVSYHLRQTDVCLFSPHVYHQMHGGYSEVHGNCIKMLLKTSEIQIAIVKEKHNLPVVFDSFASPKAKRAFASNIHSSTCHTRLNVLDFFNNQDLRICTPLGVTGHDHYTNFGGSCIGISNNENLSTPQKELLKWHWKLGVSMYRVQEMMRERHYEEPNGNKTILPVIIKLKYAMNCPTLSTSPLAQYITLAANDCGYGGTAQELIVSYVHPLFLKAHLAASKADNPSWREATRGKFADER
jgi:hypothetical protein